MVNSKFIPEYYSYCKVYVLLCFDLINDNEMIGVVVYLTFVDSDNERVRS